MKATIRNSINNFGILKGLPIPCLYDPSDKDKKNPIITKDLIETMKQLIKKDGCVDFWWSTKYDKCLTKSVSNSNTPQNTHTEMEKSKDILDIWFDSGSSFNSVLDNYLSNKVADLYCEGIDQFSGWFQSSLLLSIASNNQAPYKSLLVHGFVVDEQNRMF